VLIIRLDWFCLCYYFLDQTVYLHSFLIQYLFIFLSGTNRNMEILILKVLIQLMLAMEELPLCLIVSIGWRAIHGMDVMDLLSVLTAQ
jgi:hypothetical protein